MFKVQRQGYLLQRIQENASISVNELAAALNTSMMTIRRDLNEMQENNILKRVHGGAVISSEDAQPSFLHRAVEERERKEAIAVEAAKRIKKGDIVVFDSSTTTLEVVKAIPAALEFTAITTGLQTAIVLCGKPKAEVINIGGIVHSSSYTAHGHFAVDMLKKFAASTAFISTKAVDIREGTFEAMPFLIEIKQAIAKAAKNVILVADSTKLNTTSLTKAVGWNMINELITNDDKVFEINEISRFVKVTAVPVRIMKSIELKAL